MGPEESLEPLITKMFRKAIAKNAATESDSMIIFKRGDSSKILCINNFEDLQLRPKLLKGVQRMGFTKPSKIQQAALPALMAKPPNNAIINIPEVVDRMATIALSMLMKVDEDKRYPQVLCLSPTHELAIQAGEIAAHIGKFCQKIKLLYALSGEEIPTTMITKQVVIGTPGTVFTWGYSKQILDLCKIKVLIITEAYLTIRTPGLSKVVTKIQKLLNQDCQILFFSEWHDKKMTNTVQRIVPNFLTILKKSSNKFINNIDQYCVVCADDTEKYNAITNTYKAILDSGQMIIFCSQKSTVYEVAKEMRQKGLSVAALTGKMSVQKRVNALDQFRTAKEKILITTDVFAQGIVMDQVKIVVNYDLPTYQDGVANCRTYMRRIMKTGEIDRRGVAVTLVFPTVTNIAEQIEASLNFRFKKFKIND